MRDIMVSSIREQRQPGVAAAHSSPNVQQKSSYEYDELIQCARGELFGPGNAQLPLPPMLMFDRIPLIAAEGGRHNRGEIVAELDVRPGLWFFDCHFEGDPVMPGCLGLDAMWQLVGFFLGWSGGPGRGRALGSGEVKFTGEIHPHNRLVTYHIHMKRIIKRKLYMGIADAELSADGHTIYSAEGLRVGLFQSGENLGA